MKKNTYIPPVVEVLKVSLEASLMAMSSPESGIHWGGNAGENGTPDPDAKDQGAWDIWH